MKLYSIYSKEFRSYGEVLSTLDCSSLVKALDNYCQIPEEVVYVPSVKELEDEAIFTILQDNVYGGMPIQIGHCSGHNTKLNCLEYHIGSEVNVSSAPFILLLALSTDIEDNKLDTEKVKAFLVPSKVAVRVYETTLHYAPCNATENGFNVIIVLPKNTNTELPKIEKQSFNDSLLWARNKWLLSHPDSAEAHLGAYVGLVGKNIDLSKEELNEK